MKRLILIAFFALMIAFPHKSWAFNAVCAAKITSLEASTDGAAFLPIVGALGTGTIHAGPLMAPFLLYLDELIDCASFNVYQGEVQLSTVLTSSFTQLEDDMIQDDSMVANEITNAIVTKEMGGATPSAPSVAVGGAGCQSVDAAAQIATGAMGESAAKTAIASNIVQIRRNTSNQSQSLAYVNTQSPSSFDDSSLFTPSSSSIDATGSGPGSVTEATHYIMNLTDPTPPPRPSTLNQTTPAARQMIANLKIYDARMNLAQGAIERIASWNTATYPLSSWFTKSMTTMGAPIPATSSSGLISEHQMMGALVGARFASPAWYSNVAVENTSDLLREIAYQNAIITKILYNQYELSLRNSAINASAYAMRIHP